LQGEIKKARAVKLGRDGVALAFDLVLTSELLFHGSPHLSPFAAKQFEQQPEQKAE
jgi:hypothetical protein